MSMVTVRAWGDEDPPIRARSPEMPGEPMRVQPSRAKRPTSANE
jgi:hypothetical protein